MEIEVGEITHRIYKIAEKSANNSGGTAIIIANKAFTEYRVFICDEIKHGSKYFKFINCSEVDETCVDLEGGVLMDCLPQLYTIVFDINAKNVYPIIFNLNGNGKVKRQLFPTAFTESEVTIIKQRKEK